MGPRPLEPYLTLIFDLDLGGRLLLRDVDEEQALLELRVDLLGEDLPGRGTRRYQECDSARGPPWA